MLSQFSNHLQHQRLEQSTMSFSPSNRLLKMAQSPSGEDRSDVNSLNRHPIYHSRQDVSPGSNLRHDESQGYSLFPSHQTYQYDKSFESSGHLKNDDYRQSGFPTQHTSSHHRHFRPQVSGHNFAWCDSSTHDHGRDYHHDQGVRPTKILLPPKHSGQSSHKSVKIAPSRPKQEKQTKHVTDILPTDILSGRGGATNTHSGNKKFRKLCKEYQKFYLQARKQDKLKVAKAVVKKVRANGGRFLKRHSASIEGVVWVDVGNEEAIIKAAQCLREGAADRRKKQSSGESPSVTSEKDSVTSMSLASILEDSFSDDDENLETKKDDSLRIKKLSSRPEAQTLPRGPKTKIVKDFEDESGRFAEPAEAFITPSMTLAGESRDKHVALSINELDETDRDLYLSSFYPPNSSTETETSVKARSTKTKRKKGSTSTTPAPKPALEASTLPDHYNYHHNHHWGSYESSYHDPRTWYNGSSFDEAHHPSPYNHYHNYQVFGSQNPPDHYRYNDAHYNGSHGQEYHNNNADQSSPSSQQAPSADRYLPGFSGRFESI